MVIRDLSQSEERSKHKAVGTEEAGVKINTTERFGSEQCSVDSEGAKSVLQRSW